MNIVRTSLTEELAKEMCNWKYEGEYAIYNYPPWEEIVTQGWSMTKEENRQSSFLAFVDDANDLVGVVQLSNQGNEVQLGINLRPDLCGQGIGKKIVAMTLTQSQERYPDKSVMLEVRTWNARAIKCYQSQGFVITGIKESTKGTCDEFYVMQCDRNMEVLT